MGDVWLVIEKAMVRQTGLLAKEIHSVTESAKRLGTKSVCVVLGSELSNENCFQFASNGGFDSVFIVDHPHLRTYCPTHYLCTLTQLVQNHHPSLIVFPHHFHFQDIAAHLAQIFHVPCALNYDNLSVSGEQTISLNKGINSNQEQITVAMDLKHSPLIIILQRDTWQILRNSSTQKPVINTLPINLNGYPVQSKLVNFGKLNTQFIDLDDADIIVAGGGGVNTAEGWSLLQQLALELSAKIAGSRVACTRGFITDDQVVGISGKKVSPRIYIAIGISGSYEHLLGMRTSELIVCINRDKSAPIFNYAHLGIVADLYKFLPELIELIRTQDNLGQKERQNAAEPLYAMPRPK